MSRKIGLSEFTSQRLAELKARRAEAEASDNNQTFFVSDAPPSSGLPVFEEPVKPSPPPLASKPVCPEKPSIIPPCQPSTAIIEPFSQTISSKFHASINTNVIYLFN